MDAAVMERFMSYVMPEPNSGCWLWTGTLNTQGYGRFHINGKRPMAHKYVFEALVKKVPEGLSLDHLCRVRCCVNPQHLEPVTTRENIMRGENKVAALAGRTHCNRGHEFTAENTSVRKHRGKTYRGCKKCHCEDSRARTAQAKGELA